MHAAEMLREEVFAIEFAASDCPTSAPVTSPIERGIGGSRGRGRGGSRVVVAFHLPTCAKLADPSREVQVLAANMTLPLILTRKGRWTAGEFKYADESPGMCCCDMAL